MPGCSSPPELTNPLVTPKPCIVDDYMMSDLEISFEKFSFSVDPSEWRIIVDVGRSVALVLKENNVTMNAFCV